MKLTDSVSLGDARVTDDGYLEANARTARTGIQKYLGSEVGRDDLPVVNVYRDQAEVFSLRSLETFSKLPVTLGHPQVMVDASNWREHAVGISGDDVLRDGEYLKIGLKITDAAAVAAIKGGMRELSVGYTTHLDWVEGVAPDGTPYQARQTQIRANHIAIVAAGRAGSEVRIGDGAVNWGASPLADAHPAITEERPTMADTRKVVMDGLTIETTEQGAQAIEKLQGKLTDAATAAAKADADHVRALAEKDTAHAKEIAAKDAEITAKDKEIATKDAEIEDLKSKALDAAALDRRVAERADLLAKAKLIAPQVKLDGFDDAAVRKAVVLAALGDAALADKSAAYIDARFDILVEEREKADPVRAALKARDEKTRDEGAVPNTAYGRMVSNLTDAWKGAN